jgi:hypothetical protein
MLVHTSIREPSRGRNRANSKRSRGLVATAVKLSTLWGGMSKGEAHLTLDVLLKRSMRRPLPKTSRGVKTMKIRPVLATISAALGVPVAARTTSVTIKIRAVLMLGKMNRGQKRWCGQQRWICSHGWKGSLMQKLMSKKMTMKVKYDSGSALVTRLVTKSLNSPRRP